VKVWRSRSARGSTLPVPASGDGLPAALDQQPPPGLPDPMRPQEGEMPFLDHLEALRWHIIKALGAVLVCVIACLFFAQQIVDGILMAPTRANFVMYGVLGIDAVDVVLQNRTVTGQFFAYFGTVLAAGLVIGSPAVVYQIWAFVQPGLYPDEKKGLRFASVFATGFFVTGIAFGYFILSPLALQFFAQFTVSDAILNEFDITRYFSLLLTWSFGAGLLFELPVVVVVLARLGIVTETMLRTGRRYALVIVLVVAAIFTPPDPLSQVILAVPLMLLYELSIVLTRTIERKRIKAEKQAEAEEAARASKAGAAHG
jgi:sec-independent protein translocase protein TatC